MSNAPTEIANLLYTYARLIDGGDYAGIGELFAHARLTAEHSDMDVRGEEAIAARGEPCDISLLSLRQNPRLPADRRAGCAAASAHAGSLACHRRYCASSS